MQRCLSSFVLRKLLDLSTWLWNTACKVLPPLRKAIADGYYRECRWGNVLASSSTKQTSGCDMACAGAKSEQCGGGNVRIMLNNANKIQPSPHGSTTEYTNSLGFLAHERIPKLCLFPSSSSYCRPILGFLPKSTLLSRLYRSAVPARWQLD